MGEEGARRTELASGIAATDVDLGEIADAGDLYNRGEYSVVDGAEVR
jgi:hypothetical protein